MTTRNAAHTTINSLIHKMREMGTTREGHTLTWTRTPGGYWLVWEQTDTRGQAFIVFLGKGPKSAQDTAWDMIAVLEAVTRNNDRVGV